MNLGYKAIYKKLVGIFILTSYLTVSSYAEDPYYPQESKHAQTGDIILKSGEISPTNLHHRSAWSAELIREGKPIPNLVLITKTVPVTLVPNNGRLKPTVEIHIHFEQPGWVLFAESTPILQDNYKNDYTVFAYLNSKITEITLTAVSPTGEMLTEKILIMAPAAQELPLTGVWGEGSASIGFATFRYSQTGFGVFVSKSAILSISYTSPRWTTPLGIYASGQMTMITFSSNPINNGPQILEGKLDATYMLNSNPADRYDNRAILGINYLTMFSNGSSFGFSNLLTPEMGFQSNYKLSQNTTLQSDFRYSPAGNSINLSQRGIDFDIKILKHLKALNKLELGVYYTNFSYQANSGANVTANLFSIQLGYGF